MLLLSFIRAFLIFGGNGLSEISDSILSALLAGLTYRSRVFVAFFSVVSIDSLGTSSIEDMDYLLK